MSAEAVAVAGAVGIQLPGHNYRPSSAKLSPPRLAPETTLRRARLLELLHTHLRKRATLVTAPAGFGKTTLLAQFATEVDALTCWCTLDEGDRDGRLLLAGLVAAVARRVPGFGQRTLAALDAPAAAGDLDEAQQIRPATGLLVTELEEEIADYLLLVVDDCHVIAGSASARAALDLLLRQLPAHCHLLIAGRTLPDLPCLPGLLARRQVARLDEAGLRLTVEEARALVRLQQPAELSAAQVDALHAQTLGWPIAVSLLAQSAVREDDSFVAREAEESFPDRRGRRRTARRGRAALFAFLAAEVLDQQPRTLSSLLLDASVLPEVDTGRCAVLLGRPPDEVRRLLAAAEARGLFLARVDFDRPPGAGDEEAPSTGRTFRSTGEGEAAISTGGIRITYRFHDLFREFLLATLREQQPIRYRWLERRASALAEAAGEVPAAVRHALAGRHVARAARLIEQAAPDCVARGLWRTLRDWLAALPIRALNARPQLLLFAARAGYALDSDYERANGFLVRAERTLAPDACGVVETQLVRAALLVPHGRYAEAAALCHAAIERMGEGAPAKLRAEALFRLGFSLQRLGRLSEAHDRFAAAADLYADLGDPAQVGLAHDGLGFISLQLGRLEPAASHLGAAQAIWRRLGNYPALARTLNNLGLVHHYLAEYAPARELFTEASRLARAAALPRIEACAWLSLGDLERDLDAFAQAHAAYDRGLRLAQDHQDSYMTRCGLDALGQVHRLCGDLARAEALARRAAYEAQSAGSRYEEGLYLRSLGLVYLARREYGRAQALLDSALALLVAAGAGRELARTRLYRAQLAWASRRRKAAQTELAALVDLLADLGYYGFLLADARRAQAALEYGVGSGVGGDRLVSLLADALAHRPEMYGPAPGEPALPVQGTGDAGEMAKNALPRLEARALGDSEVRANERTVSEAQWHRTKSKELFFYLLCHPGWRRRDEIVADMWPDASPPAGRSAFHTNAHRLRRVLHPALLEQREGRYRLHPGAQCWFDVVEFERRCQAANAEPDLRQKALLAEALALYRGPFLADLSPDWAQPLRDRLEALFVAVAVRLARRHTDGREYGAALDLARRALAADPYLEPAHELVMVCHALAGRPAAALHHYRRYAALLREELGEAPPRELAALYQRLQGKPQTV